nr:GntR family transcriptional regulator [Bradyrhizobium sp. CCBAU 21360]
MVGGPLHERVRQEITRRVIENKYKVGEPLPSSAALAEELGVSMITIRRALRDLQSTGLLYPIRGVGTFVRERRRLIRELDFALASVEQAPRLELESHQSTVVTWERIRNSALNRLDAPDEPMVCVRKIISVNGTLAIFDTSYLPLSFNDKLVDELGNKSVREALRNQGTRFRKTRLLIDAAPASEEAQRAFGIPNGYPTLRRLYHLTTGDPSFSVFGIAEIPFDRLAYAVELEILPSGR